MTSQI